ncbi:MAG: ImmA/IrrE family metallo-endopeptidase [Chloroflexia bacterium]|nr:ImmA/IrrE family metallo-endopeptidase [Chloroflexia bacterium]
MERHVLETIDPHVIGERLADARRARRLTQQHAAETLDVARTTITAMETGVRRPRASELLILARLYGRQVGDFVRPVQQQPAPSFVVQFRAARGPTDGISEENRDADTRRFEELCRWYVELEKLVASPLSRRYPDVYDISDTPPERAAEEVATSERNRLALGDGPIGDLWGVLETDVGLRIFAMPMRSLKIAGMFVYVEDYGGCVAVNANHPEEKRRCSVAHEYAHFLTARLRAEITVLSSYRRVPHGERFADAFARFFLMPASGLVRRFLAMRRAKDAPITPADVLTLAHLYKVSFQAMIWRLEELKLLPSGTWDKLQNLGFKPGKARDLIGLKAPTPERSLLPLRYEALAAQAYTNGLLSEGQLARRLVTDRVGALLRVRQLTHEAQPSEDGEWHQVDLDLNAALVGT